MFLLSASPCWRGPLSRIKQFILSPNAIYTGVAITIVSGLAAFITSFASSLILLTPQAYERKMSFDSCVLVFRYGVLVVLRAH